jgi:hypothetical protein
MQFRSATVRGLPAALIVVLLALPGVASNDPAALCTRAARVAATETGVPFDTLIAVSLVETGRDFQPWPWTVNLGGEGHWAATAEAAAALVQGALDRGTTNIDLGCFQLNYRWHAPAFASIEDMLDPERNAVYAAEYLARQHDRTGDWALAAAAYHSATPEHADRYRARYEATVNALGVSPENTPDPAEPRRNGFPLLIAGNGGRNGSLVPATSGTARLVGGP